MEEHDNSVMCSLPLTNCTQLLLGITPAEMSHKQQSNEERYLLKCIQEELQKKKKTEKGAMTIYCPVYVLGKVTDSSTMLVNLEHSASKYA